MRPITVAAIVAVAVAASSLATYFLVAPAVPVAAPASAALVAPAKPDNSAELAQLQEKLAKAEARVAQLEAMPDPAPAPAATPAPEPEPEKKPDQKKPSLDEIREAIKKNGGVSAQIQALTELMFAELFGELNLDPETKAALRQFLLDEQMEEIALTQYAMTKGDIPWNQVAQWRSDERAILDEQVKSLLSKDAYKTWQAYAAAADDHQVEASLRNQIKAFSSGLTDENFEVVMQVAMEEFRAEQDALDHSNTAFTTAENLNYQIRAMENMRTRLQQSLSADQFAEINNWLNMGINMFRNQLAAMAKPR